MEAVSLLDSGLAVKVHTIDDSFICTIANVYGLNVWSDRSDLLDLLCYV